MAISADAYPSRPDVDRNGGMDNLQRFLKDNVRPTRLPSTQNDDAPEREMVGLDVGSHVLASRGAPRAESSAPGETLGAMHRPVTTRSYPSAPLGQEGFPANWRQAARPNSGSAVS